MKTGFRSLLEMCAAFSILFFLLGCATNTGVVQLSGNTYMISKSDAAGAFSNLGALKAGVIREANAFAESKGKVAVARSANMTIPAAGFPNFEYQFELLDKDDPRANGVTLNPQTTYVVKKIYKGNASGAVLPTFKPGSSVSPASGALMLFGGENHRVFLGCLNCSEYDENSIHNEYGSYGSKYSDTSIWNTYGSYGSRYSDDSPWNPYASNPPAIVDDAGNFYGHFTVNTNDPQRTTIRSLLVMLGANSE